MTTDRSKGSMLSMRMKGSTRTKFCKIESITWICSFVALPPTLLLFVLVFRFVVAILLVVVRPPFLNFGIRGYDASSQLFHEVVILVVLALDALSGPALEGRQKPQLGIFLWHLPSLPLLVFLVGQTMV
jgi:hypothetical protein